MTQEGWPSAANVPAGYQIGPELPPTVDYRGAPVVYTGGGPVVVPGQVLVRALPKRRNPFAVWLGLPLITLGVYSLVWYYKINRETRFHPNTRVSPAAALFTLVFGSLLVIPAYVSVYRTGERIAEAQRAAGLDGSCSGALGIILTFLFGAFPLYYQHEMNKVTAAYPGAAEGTLVPLRRR